MASDTGLIRPAQALDLHQRPLLTVLQLVHTEGVTAVPRLSGPAWQVRGRGSCRCDL